MKLEITGDFDRDFFLALCISLKFMYDMIEASGGCDHDVGICICHETDQAEYIEKVLKKQEQLLTERYKLLPQNEAISLYKFIHSTKNHFELEYI